MMRTWARRLWHRTVTCGFGLLYNELAWLYDPVSWVVSLGRWRAWQQAALPFLAPGGSVLEVAFGPGHLLADLAGAGYRPVGLDLSAAMLRQARRKLHRQGLAIPLCRGDAETLPFGPRVFDAVVVTFPTRFVYEPVWIRQLDRVLREGGRLVVVEMTRFHSGDPASRSLEWLFGITGQRGPGPDLPALLSVAGLVAWRDLTDVEGTSVGLVLAEKGASSGRLACDHD